MMSDKKELINPYMNRINAHLNNDSKQIKNK